MLEQKLFGQKLKKGCQVNPLKTLQQKALIIVLIRQNKKSVEQKSFGQKRQPPEKSGESERSKKNFALS
jgi:hypothetical protein